ncbi:MAG TPA: hypothetical protein VFI31_06505 [Pirellulales bacterium]|nr:hypothetical protein [Pirellulales bacterium]
MIALLSTLGCSHSGEQAGPPTASKVPVPPSPLEVTRDPTGQSPVTAQKQSVPFDESDEWVPMTGDEQVIVDNVSQLTDGVPVEAVSAEQQVTEAAAGARSPVER